jgi:Membrane-associated sensor, integral membrane domain
MANSSASALSQGPARRSVALVVGVFAVLALALRPIADHPGPAMPGIVVLSAAGFLVTELTTTFLLLVRFRAVPTWSLLVLGCAYFYSGLMPIPHLLTFPGAVLAERPLLGTSSQSTSWIYVLWINGFAFLSLIAVGLEASFGERRIATENTARAVTLGLSLTAAAALAVILIAIAGADYLPPQVRGSSFTRLGLATAYLGYGLLAASIATILFAIDGQNRLFLWLGLALTVTAFANIRDGRRRTLHGRVDDRPG